MKRNPQVACRAGYFSTRWAAIAFQEVHSMAFISWFMKISRKFTQI